jgi:phosphohistidine phosphatase
VHDGTAHGERTELYLIRHADAGDPGAWTGSDDVRPLSGKGEKQAKRLGRFLAELGFRPDAVITSPKTRARQTAEIVADALGVEIAIDERLAGGVDVVAIEAILFDAGEPERPVLVGHDPDLSELTSWIAGAGPIALKKGALVRIDTIRPISQASGALRWLVPPDLLAGR